MDLTKEVVHVNAVFESGSNATTDCKKFAIDPNITNYGVLLAILIKCFNTSSDISVRYRVVDGDGKQSFVPLESDWDLDEAISSSSVPCLQIKVTAMNRDEKHDDLHIILPDFMHVYNDKKLIGQLTTTLPNSVSQLGVQTSSMLSSVSQKFSKTMATLQRAIGMRWDGLEDSTMGPMKDHEFWQFFDQSGRVQNLDSFFCAVYWRGIDHRLRQLGWCFLLGVCPIDTTAQDRMSLLESKARQYQSIKQAWKLAYVQGRLSASQLATLASVSIDVVRTDWTSKYYMGPENRHRVCQLFDLLATYSIYHPTVGYNQGMSDLASPLLLVYEDEVLAYFSFCVLMQRVKENFHCANQRGLIGKMRQLYDLLVYFDPQLAHFLHMRNLSDLYFTQRWLMLELKREFSMDDCLRLFESQWAAAGLVRNMNDKNDSSSSTTNCQSERHLILAESSVSFNLTHSRDQPDSSLYKYLERDIGLINSLIGPSYMIHSPNGKRSDDQSDSFSGTMKPVSPTPHSNHPSSSTESDDASVSGSANLLRPSTSSDVTNQQEAPQSSTHYQAFANRRAYRCDTVPKRSFDQSLQFASVRRVKPITRLPPPSVLGHGNPFLLFICLSLLLEYRETLLATVSEPSDIIAFYQQARTKHNLLRVLNRARALYGRYLDERKWVMV